MKTDTRGILYAVGAYLLWGFFPVYWKLLKHVPAMEIFAHRIVWASVFFLLLLGILRRRSFWTTLLAARRHVGALLLTACLVGTNWYIYIYAVNTGQVLEASLGYFINPLVSVMLGRIFLQESLTRLQKISVGLACLGVLQLVVQGNHFPWIALTLAFSFGTYGLVRKKIPLDPLLASTVESALLVAPAVVYLLASNQVTSSAPYSDADWALLIFAGAVTALPLLWFAKAGKLLPLAMLGFLQYMTPTIQFLLAVFLYDEPFSSVHLLSFSLIWAGLILFTFSKYRARTIVPSGP